MSGWADEYESSVELVNEAANKLREIDPHHELLRFWFCKDEELKDGKLDPKKEKIINEEMKTRFLDNPGSYKDKPGIIVWTVVMTYYYRAILKAIEECDRMKQPQVS